MGGLGNKREDNVLGWKPSQDFNKEFKNHLLYLIEIDLYRPTQGPSDAIVVADLDQFSLRRKAGWLGIIRLCFYVKLPNSICMPVMQRIFIH